MEIKKLIQAEKADAMHLVWDVFLEFEAPDYMEEGINTFLDFINDENQIIVKESKFPIVIGLF